MFIDVAAQAWRHGPHFPPPPRLRRWYTAYTPYQAEIAQGRLEMLLTFQTMVADLTGLPVSNASLLDEATAAAETMSLCLGHSRGKKTRFVVADDVYPQTLDVIRTRADALGVHVDVQPSSNLNLEGGDVCGVLLQYPNNYGDVPTHHSARLPRLPAPAPRSPAASLQRTPFAPHTTWAPSR